MKVQASALVCPRCRGELLDRQDAERLLSRFPLPPLPETDPAKQRARACGLCGGAMSSHRVQSGQTVELCGTCASMFLEFGEARLIHQAAMLVVRPPPPAMPGRRPSAPSSAPGAAAESAQVVRDAPIGIPERDARSGVPQKPPALLGVLVLLFRLLPVVMLVAAGWHFRDSGVRVVETFRSGPAIFSATADLGSVRTVVAAEIAGDRWPSDLPAFLRKSLQSDTAHLDRWGTPYELRGSPLDPILASCGPNKVCNDEDDLLVPLFRMQRGNAPDPGIDDKIKE